MRIQRRNVLIVGVAGVTFLVGCMGVCFALWPPNRVTGIQTRTLSANPMAELSIIYGGQLVDGLRKQQNQLFLLITCPDLQRASNQSQESGLNYEIRAYPRWHKRWETTGGMIELSVSWNIWTGTITVGNKKFNRKNGNVFVIVRQPTGEWQSWQCGSLEVDADYDAMVRHIRNACREHFPTNR